MLNVTVAGSLKGAKVEHPLQANKLIKMLKNDEVRIRIPKFTLQLTS